VPAARSSRAIFHGFDNPPVQHRWDLFCRVVDNFGDAGVCWRLARELAARGRAVRLVIDDPSPLAWMAPEGAEGVEVLPWPGPTTPADVVIEAFGCDPPEAYVAAMAAQQCPPVWLNLEYLSAEPYVERSHGLPSLQRNGLVKHFFYPGFTPRTGGLMRESGLLAERAAFDGQAWLTARHLTPRDGERVVSLFCYDNEALPALLADLAQEPTLLLLTPGHAQRLVAPTAGRLRTAAMPYLTQPDFDRLLWACDLNVVRGEDSLVRALWAGAPFVWQAYPQHDGAHIGKVEAMLAQWTPQPAVAKLWRAWNGALTTGWPGLPALSAWQPQLADWRERLLRADDLATQLVQFALGNAPT
jgi:uncharacterized repeat protein (TIGR03837 family)